jgi:hypothetical protein
LTVLKTGNGLKPANSADAVGSIGGGTKNPATRLTTTQTNAATGTSSPAGMNAVKLNAAVRHLAAFEKKPKVLTDEEAAEEVINKSEDELTEGDEGGAVIRAAM